MHWLGRTVASRFVKHWVHQTRPFTSFTPTGTVLEYKEYGNPEKVVLQREAQIPKLREGEVLVKMLAAPVNPADINTIQGVYAIKPDLPSVPGNEGVGEVVATSEESQLQLGDRVIPRSNALGTWRSHLVVTAADLIKIPSDIDIIAAATIAVNPGTAYRMLEDFVSLKSGDSVLQNGANSAVGQAVIQIAAARGVKTINVVRDRPDIDELKNKLAGLGATVVVTEDELRRSYEVKNMPVPKLALNCVSGRSGTELLRQLAPSGILVTYGGMSRQPLTVPVGALIFNNINLRGFWMTRWNKEYFCHPKREEMFNSLFQLVRDRKLQPPDHSLVPFDNYLFALENAMPRDGKLGKKQILVF